MNPISDSSHALIEQFFEGELSESEERAFREKLTDPDFRRLVGLYAGLGRTTRREGETVKVMKDWLQDEEKKFSARPSSEPPAAFPWRWVAGIAASLVILIGVLWWLGPVSPVSDPQMETIAASFYEDTPFFINEDMGLRESEESAFRRGQSAFSSQNYSQALDYLAAVAPENSRYLEARYLMAHAYFRTGQYASALAAFQLLTAKKIAQLPEVYRDGDAIQWYSLLAAIAAGEDRERALRAIDDFLSDHPNPQAYSYRKARELRRQLSVLE